jgi:XRE family transcriptional regulator, regulator of sulfur utilization
VGILSDLAKIIGERIRNYRTEKGFTQEKLAEEAKLHFTYIGQLERGEKQASIASAEKIADALGITIEELFSFISKGSNKEGYNTITQIVNRLQSRNIKDQKMVLKLLDTIFEWKDEK